MNKTITELVHGKRVLFITTKNIDYLRNTQEMQLLEESAATVDKIYADSKSYVKRILIVWKKILTYPMTKVDVVFAGFSPQLLLPVFFIGKFAKKTLIIDFFVSVYDTFVNDRKKFKEKSMIARFSHWLDAYIIRKADCVIVDTNADKKYFREEFGGEESKFQTMYLKADENIYYPRVQQKPQHLKDKYVVLYFGSILPLQGVEVILDAVKLLKEEKQIQVQIVGPIPDGYEKPIQENVEYIDWLSQEMLAEQIANSDLCLAGHFCAEIEKAKRTIPGKAYIYAAMGKPMILGDNVANRELYTEGNDIRFVKMGDAEALKEAILEMHLRSIRD